MDKDKNRYWSTKDELKFIQGLGTFTLEEQDPIPLLKGYLAGSEGRDWGEIKSIPVINAAIERIKQLEKRQLWSSRKRS